MSGRKTLALLVALAMLASLVLAACGPTPEPQIVERVVTQMVVETVVVEGTAQVVEKEVTKVVEVEVEKEVTPVPETVAFDQAPDPTTLTYVDFGDPASLDPQLAYETSSGEVLENVVEGLIYMRRENAAEFVPMLAEEVPTVDNGGLSADGLTYTFKIRDGIQFHEGQDLTASDAAYSWQRGLLQSDPNSGQWMMIEAIMGYSSGDITENIAEGAYAGDRDALIANATPEELVAVCEEVKSHFVVDDDAGTMQVTLAQPWGPFLAIIAKYWAYVIDQDWAIAQGDWDGSCDTWQNFYAPGQEGTKLARVVNGTGPYKLDHWTPDEEWVLVANENYWRAEGDPLWEGGPSGLPKIQRIVHRVVNEWGTRFAMMQAGDVAWGDVPQANRPQVDPWVGEICDAVTEECAPSSTPDAPLRMWINQAATSRTDIFMNQNVETDESGSNPYIGSGLLDGNGIPPDFFSDIHVRRAFAYCFDYDIYISDGQNGEGIRNSSMIITNMLGYNPDQEMFQFDLDKCAEELALAWDGQVAEVGFRVQATTNTGNLERQTAAAILQNNLRSVDPKYRVEIVTLPWPTYLAAFRAAQLPIAISAWSEDYHDPHNWAQPYLIGTFAGRSNFSDEFKEIFRPLVEQAVIEPDADARAALYHELGALAFEHVPQVYLSQPGSRHYEARWVHDYYYNPIANNYFYAWNLAGNE
jgi:peptide/nickel transport system substrate-binding protein